MEKQELVHIYLKPDNIMLKRKLHKIYDEELFIKKQKKIKILDNNFFNPIYKS